MHFRNITPLRGCNASVLKPSPRLRIGLVTCAAEKLRDYFPTAAEPELVPTEPPFTPDDQRLVGALRRRGHHAAAVVWGVDVYALREQFDVIVVRSPWDYMDSDEQRQLFLTWLGDLHQHGPRVENDAAVMLWLMDKRYLLDFEQAGVSIVPTEAVGRDTSLDLVERHDTHGPLIVKHAISAAGAGLVFLNTRAEAAKFQSDFDERRRSSVQLVQPFLPEIKSHGEWSLVYLGGEYSHAVHKRPGAGGVLVHAEQGGSLRFADPPAIVRQAGDLVAVRCRDAFAVRDTVAPAPGAFPSLYLRIDIIETAAGALLSECEGVEPELFFRARAGSEVRCCELIESRCAATK